MSKYKSLIYREWKLSSKHYILRFVTVLLFALLFALAVKFAADSGSLVEEGGFGPAQFAVFVSCLISMAVSIIAAEDNGVHNLDVKVDWVRYSYALPITAFEKTVTKYVFKLGAAIFGALLTFICSTAVCALSGASFDINTIVLYVLFLDVILIYDLIVQVIVLRARDKESLKKAKTIAGAVAFFIVFIVPEFFPSGQMDAIDEMESPAELLKLLTVPQGLAYCVVPVMLVILAVGFILTWKNLERREE